MLRKHALDTDTDIYTDTAIKEINSVHSKKWMLNKTKQFLYDC